MAKANGQMPGIPYRELGRTGELIRDSGVGE